MHQSKVLLKAHLDGMFLPRGETTVYAKLR